MPHKVKVPASVASLDFDRVRKALFRADGDVTRAAKSLKVKSADLRRLTWRHPKLIMDALERAHRLCDRAEAKLREALDDAKHDRSDRAAMFILSHSAAARERGWGRHGGDAGYDALSPAVAINVIWPGGASGGYRPLAPNVPEARLADASSSTDPASKGDRIH